VNWVQVCHDAVSASADEGRACRARVERDPDDITARVQRIGQLFLDLEPDAQAERAEHLCWWVRHRPDVDLGGFGFVDRTSFQEAYEAVRGAWRAALEAHPTDVDVLLAAVAFLGVYEPEEAEPLARRAMGLSPERAKGPQVVVLRRLGRWAEALVSPSSAHRLLAGVGHRRHSITKPRHKPSDRFVGPHGGRSGRRGTRRGAGERAGRRLSVVVRGSVGRGREATAADNRRGHRA